MKKRKLIRLTSTLTALALSLTLTAGCEYKKRDKFYFSYNLKGEAFIHKNDYISSEFINNYYLISNYLSSISIYPTVFWITVRT